MTKKKIIVTADQMDFLTGGSSENTQIEAAKQILLEAGYKVTKPEVTTKVSTVKGLKDYFYNRLYQKYPDRLADRVPNVQMDMRFAKLFFESRIRSGDVGDAVAFQDCVDVIDVIFDHEKEFMFKYPIMDISILGQGKLGWITQKAIELLNKEKTKAMARKTEEMLREIEDNMEVDLEEKSNRLTQMLKNVEEKDG